MVLFSNWLVKLFGYETAMLIKNLFIFITGFSAGTLIMHFISVKVMRRYRVRDDMLPSITVMKIKHDGKNYFFANPSNIFEASYIFFYCFFLGKNKPYEKKEDSSRKIKAFVVGFFTLLILSHLIGILMSTTVIIQP